jgi:hypothetical protein
MASEDRNNGKHHKEHGIRKAIPASKLINIDLECNISSHEVIQIGLADLEGEKVLDFSRAWGFQW